MRTCGYDKEGDSWPAPTCNGSAGQAWSLEQGEGTLTNPATGLCLTDPDSSATAALAAEIFNCAANPAAGGSDHFQLPDGPIVSAVGTMCAEDPGSSTVSGIAVEIEPCDGSSAQSWGDFSDFLFSATGEPDTHQGLCLTALAQTNLAYPFEYLENTPVAVNTCTPTPVAGQRHQLPELRLGDQAEPGNRQHGRQPLPGRPRIVHRQGRQALP